MTPAERLQYKADWMRRKRDEARQLVMRKCTNCRCSMFFFVNIRSRRKYCSPTCRVASHTVTDDMLDRKAEEIWREKADAEYYVGGGWRGIGSRSPMTDL